MVKNRLKTDRILLIWLALTATWNIVNQSVKFFPFSTYSYIALILFWMWTLKDEITDVYIRRRLICGGILFVFLFILRILRWEVLSDGTYADRFCWYLYYIPTIVTPLISLYLSIYIGDKDRTKKRPYMTALRVLASVLIVLVLTNDFHGTVLKIWYEGDKAKSSAGPVYIFIIAWYFILMILAFVIMLYKCRILSSRKHSWVIFITEGIGLILLVIYYIGNGSSPHIGGYSLYNVQEVYMLVFLGLWEDLILIGLIPSASLIKEREWISDGILRTVVCETEEIKEIFGRMWKQDDESFKKSLVSIGCLCAYIKRRANLELITDQRGFLSTSELSLAIRESLDYYALSGISVGYEETGKAEVPALLLTAGYELFEDVMERSEATACYVRIQTAVSEDTVSFALKMEVDGYDLNEDYKNGYGRKICLNPGFLEALGATVSVTDQDDTTFITLTASYFLNRSNIFKLKLFGKTLYDPVYGLSGLIHYLSIEKEALSVKIRIHDILGRSLLMLRRYLTEPGSVSREMLFAELNRTIAILADGRKEPDNERSKDSEYTYDIDTCIRQAYALGIDVILHGELPKKEALNPVIDTAITVHITNVLKHTTGKTVTIDIDEQTDMYVMSFENDGDRRLTDEHQVIEETGGLKNLRISVEGIGGTMEVKNDKRFKMILTLPKEDHTELGYGD